MINAYINRNKFNVFNDYLEFKKLDLLHQYKTNILNANNKSGFVKDLPESIARFNQVEIDNQGIEVSQDISENYPFSIEEEQAQISLKSQNLQYLRKSRDNFETCRTTCKVPDVRLRNFVALPTENQMCLTDCLNVRYELYLTSKPGNTENTKKFIWTA